MTMNPAEPPMMKNLEFSLFKNLVYTHAGILFSNTKELLMRNRLGKRLDALGLRSFIQYYDLVTRPENAGELHECLNVLTTNETLFFRHKEHWDFLDKVVIPEWKATHAKEAKFRLWSAAASTGAEAYSAAIRLHDLLPRCEGYRFGIDATDINQNVLDQAERAEFDDHGIKKIEKDELRRYFIHDLDRKLYRLRPEIASLVRFQRQNLLEPSKGMSYDLVFLCNVLFYFDDESKSKALEHVVSRMRRGSYLFLGGADSLPARKVPLECVANTIHKKK